MTRFRQPGFSPGRSPADGRTFRLLASFLFLAAALLLPSSAAAQDTPYIVTYSHHLEEPDNLEIEAYANYATQKGGRDFIAPWMELEYGVTAWWTTEFYLDSQTTFGDSALFTGTRWENRFRPLMREHWINPALYVEFENINGADKTMKEVVGSDGQADHALPNALARRAHLHEIETKLIFSSDYRGWNISENFTAEKNLAHAPWEFGYALGASRPLRLAAAPRPCDFCGENFALGAELYGGLGTTDALTLSGTSHYFAPIVAWQLPSGVNMTLSPGFGLNDNSHRFVLRWGVSYEIAGFGRRLRSLLH
ncbi:MAG TPA: hypothetical protein VJO53_09670 [Candidatus Acidoferrales bacterium]|nr:hypothetical protein [Candidatus Acidoferrales bacterium]